MLEWPSIELANGLRIVVVPQPHLHAATATLVVRCGSRHEARDQWGLSHFVEHMLFRGSRRFADSRRLAHVFESAGGSLQAATWRDHTEYSVTFHPSHVGRVLGAMADMAISPLLTGVDLERGIIEQELMAELDENGDDIDLSNVTRAHVWPDHPMGRRITGSLDSLYRFCVDDLRTHHAAHYTGRNTVLCVAGRVDGPTVQALASDLFASLPVGKSGGGESPPTFAPSKRVYMREHPASQLGVQIVFESLPDTHRDFVPMTLLSTLLDDGVGSRLPYALCERRGLVYELSSGLDCYNDAGLYDVEMQVAPEQADQAIAVTFEALHDVCTLGVKADELDAARQRHLHDLEFQLDATEELSSGQALDCLFKRQRSVASERAQLRAVEPSDVERVAKKLFATGNVHVTLLGPIGRAAMGQIEKRVDEFARGTRLGL